MRSKRFTKALVGAAFVIFLAAMMLFPLGCSKMLPTTPEDPQEGYRAEDLWPAPPANLFPSLRTCSKTIFGWFGPDGGEMHVRGKCMDASFYVPKYALSERVRISMTATIFYYYNEHSVLNGVLLNFRPDGLVFSKAAVLKLKADVLEARDGDLLTLYWYNPDTGLWEVEQKIRVDDEEVEFQIFHFSRYAIS